MKQRESGLPFDDIRNLVSSLPPLDNGARAHTTAQLDGFPKDTLSQICKWLSASTGRSPSINRPLVTLFAGTHTLENKLDDGKGAEDLLEDVTRISSGGDVVNRLCAQHDIGLKVFDLALQIPVDDIARNPALDEKGCAGTIAFGMEAIAGGTDLLCLAGLGHEHSISNLAILAVLMDADMDAMLALRGDGNPQDKQVLRSAVGLAMPHKDNPLEVLRRVGGRETAALCGGILAARAEHVPLILNGVGALAAACVLHALNPSSLDHVIFGQDARVDVLSAIQKKLGIHLVLSSEISASHVSGLVLAASMTKSACCLIAV